MISWEQFLVLANKWFDFLIRDFGFRCTSQKIPFLTYDSNKIRISIFYESDGRGELDLAIKRLTDIGKGVSSFGLSGFKRLVGFVDTKLSPFPRTEEEMEKELKCLSEELKTYCQGVLRGQVEDFELIEAEEKALEKKMSES